MTFFRKGLREAWHLIITGDPYLRHLTWVTLKVAAVSVIVALVIGLPIGLALGLGRFRGRNVGLTLANAGLGLPPVIVGLVMALLLFPIGPLGRLHLLFTLHAVYLAQSILAVPIIIALTAAAVRAISPGLLDQARAFGASTPRVWVLAVREARVGIFAAIIAAIGSALSEVGAVVLVGGNIQDLDQTLASAALQKVDAGDFTDGLAIGIILLGLILVITALLTLAQYRGARIPRVRAPS
jgi:tungstate transport system permease protein